MELVIKRVIELNASAEEWGLYDMDGSDDVAKMMNRHLARVFNRGDSRDQVEHFMVSLMEQAYSEFGAADSEPRAFLGYVLDRAFGLTTGPETGRDTGLDAGVGVW